MPAPAAPRKELVLDAEPQTSGAERPDRPCKATHSSGCLTAPAHPPLGHPPPPSSRRHLAERRRVDGAAGGRPAAGRRAGVAMGRSAARALVGTSSFHARRGTTQRTATWPPTTAYARQTVSGEHDAAAHRQPGVAPPGRADCATPARAPRARSSAKVVQLGSTARVKPSTLTLRTARHPRAAPLLPRRLRCSSMPLSSPWWSAIIATCPRRRPAAPSPPKAESSSSRMPSEPQSPASHIFMTLGPSPSP